MSRKPKNDERFRVLVVDDHASAREAVDSVLARLHEVNPAINAVVRVLEQEARASAETADAARARGHALPPLHGAPVTIKVNVDMAGLPTDNGVVALKDFIAQEDSPVVANLKHAGAIIIGRTNAPAFSKRIFSDNALHGRTLNPLDPGEYAVVQYSLDKLDMQVWDFFIAPGTSAPPGPPK